MMRVDESWLSNDNINSHPRLTMEKHFSGDWGGGCSG